MDKEQFKALLENLRTRKFDFIEYGPEGEPNSYFSYLHIRLLNLPYGPAWRCASIYAARGEGSGVYFSMEETDNLLKYIQGRLEDYHRPPSVLQQRLRNSLGHNAREVKYGFFGYRDPAIPLSLERGSNEQA